MASYTAVCPKCAKQYEYQKPITARDITPHCPVCMVKTERRILTPPMGFVDVKAAG